MVDQAGILHGDEFVPNEKLLARSMRAASGLTSVGIGAGDTIAILMRNDLPYFEASLAAGVIGALPVPINWHATRDEITYILADAHTKMLLAHADLLPPILDCIPPDVTMLAVATPPDTRDAYDIAPEQCAVPAGVAEWHRWIKRFEPWSDQPSSAPVSAMIYTSGTTGKPKGVRRQANDGTDPAAAQYAEAIREGLGVAPGMRTVANIPLYHGAPTAYFLGAVRAGAFIVMEEPFRAERLLRLIEEHRLTRLFMVPIMFVRLLQLPEDVRRRYDLSTLEVVSHGGAPCAQHIKRAMIDWWGPIFHELYGSTESGIVTSCTSDEWLAHPGTVGRPLPGVELRVYDDDGRLLPPGEPGEIYSRVRCLPDFTYEGRPEARREIDRNGFITSGDIGYVDDDGFLHLCDRKRDMVISGGVNIYPAEIEACILRLSGVRDVAVFGIPDDEYGESLAAVIERNDGAGITADDVRTHVRAHLAGYKAPRVVEFCDDLPREDTGKIFKRKLRQPYWERTGRSI